MSLVFHKHLLKICVFPRVQSLFVFPSASSSWGFTYMLTAKYTNSFWLSCIFLTQILLMSYRHRSLNMYHEYLPKYSEYVSYHYPETQSFQKGPSFLLRCSSPAVPFSGQHLHLCRFFRPAEIWKSSPLFPPVYACGF